MCLGTRDMETEYQMLLMTLLQDPWVLLILPLMVSLWVPDGILWSAQMSLVVF